MSEVTCATCPYKKECEERSGCLMLEMTDN